MTNPDLPPYPFWYTLRERLEVLREISISQDFLANFLARGKEEPWYWINHVGSSRNPKEDKNKDRPYLMCLRQCEMITHQHECAVQKKDIVYEKSREVGGSWGLMHYVQHQWFFEQGFQCIIGSRRIELVESKGLGSTNALLNKFDYINDRLPPKIAEILAAGGYIPEKPYKVELARFNPMTGAEVLGEATTEDFGAASRGGLVVIDELSKCPSPKASWESCASTAGSRTAIFTPKGKEFAWGLAHPDEWAEQQKLNKKEVERPRIFRIHWKDLPWFNRFLIFPYPAKRGEQWGTQEEWRAWIKEHEKDAIYEGYGYGPDDEIPLGRGYDDGRGNILWERMRKPLERMPYNGVDIVWPWYENEAYRYTEEGRAAQLNIDYEGSMTGKVYVVHLEQAKIEDSIRRNPRFPLYYSLDPGRSHGNAACIGWVQWNIFLRRYEWLRVYMREGITIEYFIPLLTGLSMHESLADRYKPDEEWKRLFAEMQHPMWRVNQGTGDPRALMAKGSVVPESVKDILDKYQIPCLIKPENHFFKNRIGPTRRVLTYTAIDRIRCRSLIVGLSEIKFPPEDKRTTAPDGWEHHAVHSHPVAMCEYFCAWNPNFYDLPENGAISPEQRNQMMWEEQVRMEASNAGFGDIQLYLAMTGQGQSIGTYQG